MQIWSKHQYWYTKQSIYRNNNTQKHLFNKFMYSCTLNGMLQSLYINVAASAFITSCGVNWRSQKVWNAQATTSPNWHLANSAHHWTAVFQFPTAIANMANGNEHKPFCCHEIKKQSQQRSIAGYGFKTDVPSTAQISVFKFIRKLLLRLAKFGL